MLAPASDGRKFGPVIYITKIRLSISVGAARHGAPACGMPGKLGSTALGGRGPAWAPPHFGTPAGPLAGPAGPVIR